MNDVSALIKTAVLGTSDYHAFMKALTVYSLSQKAGYVAGVMEGEGDTIFRISKHDESILIMDTDMCWGCRDRVKEWLDFHCIPNENLYINYKSVEYMEQCPHCAYINEIPF